MTNLICTECGRELDRLPDGALTIICLCTECSANLAHADDPKGFPPRRPLINAGFDAFLGGRRYKTCA